MMYRISAITLVLVGLSVPGQSVDYGVDCSFPIHSKDFSCGDLLGDRKAIYEDFMQGCRDFYGKKGSRCDTTEDDRIEMSRRQPQSMLNFTSTGFMKIRAPKEVWDLLSAHWQRNQDNWEQQPEAWNVGNVYTNHWAAPTYMVSVENQKLRGGGASLKNAIWDAAKSTIEQWTGMEQKPTSQYGIRVYTEGAILSPHVDRLPLVSSCIVNVAQDVDEPWILEVYDRHDRAVNVTMEPGDMVLYESGSLIHGRPFPMKGRYYANIFIHFEPTGRVLGDHGDEYLDDLDDFFPPYIVPGTPEADHWARMNPHGWKRASPQASIQQIRSPEAHTAAAHGDLDRLHQIAEADKKALKKKDNNGWQPIHEAARAGHKEAVEMLIKHGAEKDARTGVNGKGSTPLNIAMDFLDKDHPLTQYLMQIGAQNIPQEEL